MPLELHPIGVVRSPFATKFGVPRQASLTSVRAIIELDPARVSPHATRGLDHATHAWIITWFDQVQPGWRPTVRPPRLGGNTRLGVFSTRSPFRPNPIGLSAVRLVRVEGTTITVEGCDWVDGTPVLDIKPYVPWTDALPAAHVTWADNAPARVPVQFAQEAEATLSLTDACAQLRADLIAVLSLDPRPPYHPDNDRPYGATMFGHDVRFVRTTDAVTVISLHPVDD